MKQINAVSKLHLTATCIKTCTFTFLSSFENHNDTLLFINLIYIQNQNILSTCCIETEVTS